MTIINNHGAHAGRKTTWLSLSEKEKVACE